MRLVRPTAPALRPFVARLWAIDETAGPPRVAARERVLPTGEMHLVFRLSEHPVRLYAGSDARAARTVGLTTVSGMRSTPYLREVGAPLRSVGVQLQALLAARLPRLHALHPAVALALERLGAGALIGDVVRESGRSHRTFIALFRQAMGLSPKLYCRVQRLQRVIRRVTAEPSAAWSDVALDAGYSDQPHLVREFRQLAGITPSQYRILAPRAHHVPLPAPAR